MPQNMNPIVSSLSRPGGFWTGYDAALMQTPRFNPEQTRMLNQAGNMGLQGLLSGTMPGGMSFEPIAKKYITNFNQDIVPSLAERFTSLGGGSQRSSAFAGTLGKAGAGLEENLASMEEQYKAHMLPYLLQLLGMGLEQQTENQFLPREAGLLENMGVGLAKGIGKSAGSLALGGIPSFLSVLKGLF